MSDILAIIGEVDPEIHEVVLAPTGLVDYGLEHGLIHFVGNVAQHDLAIVNTSDASFTHSLTVVRTSMPSRILLTSTWL